MLYQKIAELFQKGNNLKLRLIDDIYKHNSFGVARFLHQLESKEKVCAFLTFI